MYTNLNIYIYIYKGWLLIILCNHYYFIQLYRFFYSLTWYQSRLGIPPHLRLYKHLIYGLSHGCTVFSLLLHRVSLLLQQSFPLVVSLLPQQYRLLLLFLLLVMNHSPLTFIFLLQPSITPRLLSSHTSTLLQWFLPLISQSSQTLSHDCSSFKHSTSNLFKTIKHKFLILEDADETLLVRPKCVLLC